MNSTTAIRSSALALLMLGAAGTAHGQAPTYPDPNQKPVEMTPTTPMTPAPTVIETGETPLQHYGFALALGGGVEGFTGSSLRGPTSDGGAWDVRAIFGTRMPLGLELAYIGSAQAISALGIANNSVLVGNGAEATARVNLVDYEIQPFLFAGLGWRRYNLTNEGVNTSDIAERDDVLEVPMGAGLGYKVQGFMLDARGEFRYAAEADLLKATNPNADMHRWGVNANIGYAF